MRTRTTHHPLPRPNDDAARFFQPDYDHAVDNETLRKIEERMGPVAYKIENEKGQVDLRRLTGDEALTYFAAMGIPIARI